MKYKLIKNYHLQNAVLRKDFNLVTTSSFFHAFTQTKSNHGMTSFLGMHSSMDSDVNKEEDFIQSSPCHLVKNTLVWILAGFES